MPMSADDIPLVTSNWTELKVYINIFKIKKIY